MLRELNENEMMMVSGGQGEEGWIDADTIHGSIEIDVAMATLELFMNDNGNVSIGTVAMFAPPTSQNIDSDEIEAAERAIEVIYEDSLSLPVAFVEYDEETNTFVINSPATG